MRAPNHYYTLTRTSSSPEGGQHPANSSICPATVRVVATTKIDGTTIAPGRYYLNVINGVNCRTASTDFKQFLTAGATRAAWTYVPDIGMFLSGNAGFQVVPVS